MERLPHLAVGAGASRRVRVFPDRLPIGVRADGGIAFVYLVTTSMADDFRAFLQRHSDLLRVLSRWTVLLLFPRHVARVMAWYQAAARDELTTRFSPYTLNELKWYLEQRRTAPEDRTRLATDERFWQAARTFCTPVCRRLYRRWMMDGDGAFDHVSSTVIGDALACGTGRIESEVLELEYDHLSPVVRTVRSTPSGQSLGRLKGESSAAYRAVR